ncbi:MAG: LysM peptidoglycan-binding domain-containing protein [Pontiella sp.]|nr:LysM peptidoglycan-binding domain-containing protein [Pontiella sp.]MBT8046476.1 LysM peptidoglycan-binding domain-containing protein [Pontiella sp.]
MLTKTVLYLMPVLALTGCETLQSPAQRQQTAARQQAALRYSEERTQRVQGQLESIEMENIKLTQEVQQLRQDIRAFNGQLSQINGRMSSLESKQANEMRELISRVEGLLKQTVAMQPAPKASRGSGREHVVESGHTLSAIAQAYGTTVDAIKKANNLKSDNIYVGQTLFVPE